MATQSIKSFVPKREEYWVHNARPEAWEFMWGGIRFEVPAVDEIGSDPALFDDGTPIPGTVVVRDSYVFDATQQVPAGPPNWSAKEAIRAVLGVGPDGRAISKLAMNGISYLPTGCSREDYEKVREQGEARYRESLVVWAQETLRDYEEAASKAKQMDVKPKPPGQDFYKATAILKGYEDQQQKLMGTDEADDELEFMVYAKAMALKLAGTIAEDTNVDKARLVEKMLEDPMVAAQIRKKYSMRRRGYMDPTDAPGAEQPPE